MSKKALVVDNDFFFVEFLAELLEEKGYEVIKAFDGKEGMSKLEEEAVDLLFADIIMPKIDGEQLIEFTRKKFPDAHFPIIAVSGTIIEQLDRINEIRADYFITKGPIEKMAGQLNELMDRIEKQPLPSPSDKEIFGAENLYPSQVTAELMETVNFQRAITECIGAGIIVVDRDTKIMTTNSLALEITNKSIEETLNCPVTALFPRTEKVKLVNALKRVVHNQELRKVSLPVTIHSREFRAIVSLFKVDDKIAGWIIALEDAE